MSRFPASILLILWDMPDRIVHTVTPIFMFHLQNYLYTAVLPMRYDENAVTRITETAQTVAFSGLRR